jgi:anti-sigma factor RsiW
MRNTQCKEMLRLLDGFVSGTLAPRKRQEVQSHIKTCERCKAALSEEDRLVELIRKAVDLDAPPAEGVIARIREHIARKKP